MNLHTDVRFANRTKKCNPLTISTCLDGSKPSCTRFALSPPDAGDKMKRGFSSIVGIHGVYSGYGHPVLVPIRLLLISRIVAHLNHAIVLCVYLNNFDNATGVSKKQVGECLCRSEWPTWGQPSCRHQHN